MLRAIRILYVAIGLAVLAVEDLMDGVPGLQKKEEAIRRVKELVTAVLGGWPSFIPDPVVGWLIDTVVGLFNRDGTFRKAAGPQGA
ncbi:hypothetical protein [Thermus sp.]|uniref:hypothetical protein n=1 Tax=Thermus sp. TaxID=275 RepID=UPI00260E86AC|nr:hypothetical protein [Thermus sp.]MCX7850982.1 hypothetical protein [Thermus sp.]MDW8357861.1 hypothetical protein [Thermus sp.]